MQTHGSKRLSKEFEDLTKNPPDGIIVESSDLSKWNIILIGPPGTPFEGGTFQLLMEFPKEYPFKAPKTKFVTKIYHPSIKTDNGDICADIYENGWMPTQTVKKVLDILKSMLIAPNVETPLEPEIGKIYSTDRNKFNQTAKEWTSKYAK